VAYKILKYEFIAVFRIAIGENIRIKGCFWLNKKILFL